jgi:hypothetical protein
MTNLQEIIKDEVQKFELNKPKPGVVTRSRSKKNDPKDANSLAPETFLKAKRSTTQS